MFSLRFLNFLIITFASFTCVVVLGQETGVSCSSVTPIDVPRDPSLYWGTWYTIGTCTSCTSPENVCSQVAYEPVDSTKVATTNLTYIGSFEDVSPEGDNAQAFGNMIPLNVDTFDPLYRFDLDLGFAIIPSNFWVLTTLGDGNEISAIVTMSCDLADGNQQLFFLSRKPYFVPPVTFDTLVAQTRRAITNYDEFNITTVYQGQGWCDYELPETFASTTQSCNEDFDSDDRNRLRLTVGFSVLSMVFSTIILSLIVYFKCFAKGGQTNGDGDLTKSILSM